MYDQLRDECVQLAQAAQFESLLMLTQAITLEADLEDHFSAAAIGTIGMSEAYFGLGDFPKAARYARRAVYFAEQADLNWILSDALNQLSAMLRLIDGDARSAHTRARQALHLADDHSTILALIGLGAAYAQLNADPQALSTLEAALTRVIRLDAPTLEARVLNALGQVSFKLGAYPRAIEQYRLALDSARLGGDPVHEALITANLAWAYFTDKRTRPDSIETACYSLSLARSIGSVYPEYIAYLTLGRIYLRLNDPSQAAALFEAAYARATSVYLCCSVLDGLIAAQQALKCPNVAAAYRDERALILRNWR
ncbi:MAG: tetratricopeptide repeat protein [Anaerolineae bacterium]|nr:tetratricopeptide repeat protein [Anaerolineae bacterium]